MTNLSVFAPNACINAQDSAGLPRLPHHYPYAEVEWFFGDEAEVPTYHWRNGHYIAVEGEMNPHVLHIRVDQQWAFILVDGQVLLNRLGDLQLPEPPDLEAFTPAIAVEQPAIATLTTASEPDSPLPEQEPEALARSTDVPQAVLENLALGKQLLSELGESPLQLAELDAQIHHYYGVETIDVQPVSISIEEVLGQQPIQDLPVQNAEFDTTLSPVPDPKWFDSFQREWETWDEVRELTQQLPVSQQSHEALEQVSQTLMARLEARMAALEDRVQDLEQLKTSQIPQVDTWFTQLQQNVRNANHQVAQALHMPSDLQQTLYLLGQLTAQPPIEPDPQLTPLPIAVPGLSAATQLLAHCGESDTDGNWTLTGRSGITLTATQFDCALITNEDGIVVARGDILTTHATVKDLGTISTVTAMAPKIASALEQERETHQQSWPDNQHSTIPLIQASGNGR